MKNIYSLIILCLLLGTNMVGQSETEPNNTSEQANTLLYNGSQSGAISDVDNVDWYKIVIPQGGNLKLRFSADGGHEVNIYLKDSSLIGNDLAKASSYFNDLKLDSLVFPILKGTYFVAVIRSRGSGAYKIESSLNILQWPEDTEPNNEFSNALMLPVNGSVTGLIGHYDTRVKNFDPFDWYKIVVPQGGNIKLKFSADGGHEVNIYLKDSSLIGNDLAKASSYFNDIKLDSLVFPILKGTYYVAVIRSRGSGAYKIESSLKILQWPEDTEPNNEFSNALVLPVNGSVTGLIGHYDTRVKNFDPFDWYKITVPKGGNLKIKFSADGGHEVNVYLKDSSQIGNDLAKASSYFNDIKIDSFIFPLLRGTYYLAVLRARGSGAYKIESALQIPIWGEDKEPNDKWEQANEFPLNTYVTGLINHYNPAFKNYDTEDWYKIKTDKKGLLIIQLQSDGASETSIYFKDSTNINSNLASASFNFGNKVKDSLVTPVQMGIYYMQVVRSRSSGSYSASSKLIIAPKSQFIVNTTGNFATFENISTGEQNTYLWKYEDNTTATTINAYKEYKIPKNYNVCLIATNRGGVDTFCKTVIIPGVERISPSEGGNSGDVTVTVFGGGLDTNFVGKIMNGTTIIATSNNTSFDGNSSISLRFDLRTKPIGTYDFIIEKKGGSPSYKIPGGFKIVTGTKPDVWANMIGRNRILFNTWTTFTLNYGNTGNTDARVAPIWLAISDASGLDVKFPETAIIDPDTIILAEGNEQDLYEEIDSLFGKPGKWRVYPMLFPLVAAGSSHSMKMKIRSGGDLKIHTWTEKPWYQSPMNEGKRGCTIEAIDTSLFNHMDFIDCVTAFTFYQLDKFYNGNERERDRYSFLNNLPPDAPFIKVMNKIIKSSLGACIDLLQKDLSKDTQKNIRTQVMTEILTRMGLLSDKPKGPPSINSYNISNRNVSDCDTTEIEPQNPTSTTASTVSSLDPNEKAGPSGFGPNNYLRASNGFPYTIYFENKSTATAPAHQIAITDKLDPAVFDLKSFSFGKVTIGDSSIYVPSGLRAFTLDKKLTHLNVIARVSGKLDTITGNIEWLFRSLDPKTLDDIEDPDIGILPPNKTSPQGEGNVTYFVNLKNEPRHGQQVKNKASIVFDANPAIITNEHVVTFDLIPPQSSVMSLLPISASKFNIRWSGTDNGSGIQGYYIYFRVNGGADSIWLTNTTATSDTFTGKTGWKYEFWSVAVDNAGNVENKPSVPDAVTTITATHEEIPENAEILVYPNPADEYLTIINQSAYRGCLTLVKTEGQVVSRIQLQGQSVQQINVSEIPKGLIQWLWAPDCVINTRSGRIVLIR
jgi:PKD repeat protein